MADASAHAPVFPRGSTVLEYWLVHAEGLTVQPSGARVERVVVAAPAGRAETLIVRSPRTRRRRSIPAGSIAAVQPSAGFLLLDPAATKAPASRRFRGPSGDRLVAAARSTGAGTRAGTAAAAAWLVPRAATVGAATARYTRFAAAHGARGVAWVVPRVLAGLRTAGTVGAQLTYAGAVVTARGAARLSRGLRRGAAAAAVHGRASLEARRARQQLEPDD